MSIRYVVVRYVDYKLEWNMSILQVRVKYVDTTDYCKTCGYDRKMSNLSKIVLSSNIHLCHFRDIWWLTLCVSRHGSDVVFAGVSVCRHPRTKV
jgi:hypothetical protein